MKQCLGPRASQSDGSACANPGTRTRLRCSKRFHGRIVSKRLGAQPGITLDTYAYAIPGLQPDAAEQVADCRPSDKGRRILRSVSARGESRTPTPFRAPDPKSGASAVPPLSR